MKKKILLILAIICLIYNNLLPADNNQEAYRIYNNKAKVVTFNNVIEACTKADIVFFGEIHSCPIAHWLEKKTLEALYKHHKQKLILGLEMIEADNQLILDEYLNGYISSDKFEQEARLWPNHATDYAPLLAFAQENKLKVIASNIPRRYASMVKNRGLNFLDSISTEAKQYIAPLPIKYIPNAQADESFAMMAMIKKNNKKQKSFIAQAQAIKDATMAWRIIKYANTQPVMHVNGNIHSDANQGIITYIKQYAPNKKIVTLRTIRQEDISKLDTTFMDLADFYICVPEDMTNTY